MQSREETRFLDLDMVAESIGHDQDRDMFREAVSCYQIGSHRAAVILTWSATADCLRRRIQELASDNDPTASTAIAELQGVDGQAIYEENLIAKSRQCELIDDYEEKSLRFARDTRSKCAHPTGVIPSAEAVRHVLYICSQTVLCRRGYRGTAYVRHVVTVGFDDPHFLPVPEKQVQHCDEILGRVPERLWPLFTRLAAVERPAAPTQTWRQNAIAVFRRILERAESDSLAADISAGMQGFQSGAPDFFSVLVGLDRRAGTFWGQHQREQARSRLRASSASKVDPDEVAAWANICAGDGLDEPDRDLLRSKLGSFARFLQETFLSARKQEMLRLVAEMTEADTTSDQAAVALRYLLGTTLGEDSTEELERTIRQIIQRFRNEDKYRKLLVEVRRWGEAAIATLLGMSGDFFNECSEDNPDDLVFLFEAATELAERNSHFSMENFSAAIVAALNGEIEPEWVVEESEVFSILKRQSELLVERFPTKFENVEIHLKAIAEEVGSDPEKEVQAATGEGVVVEDDVANGEVTESGSDSETRGVD